LTDNTAQLIDSDVSEAYGQIASMTGICVNPFRSVRGFDAHSERFPEWLPRSSRSYALIGVA
jgi:hypothetical protein